MTAYLALNHILNFFLPALGVAALMATMSKLLLRSSLRGVGWLPLFLRTAVCNVVVSVACLILTLHDGSMMQYSLLIVSSALAVWARSLK